MKKPQEKPLSPAFVNLFAGMQSAQNNPPTDLPAAIAELPDVGELPSPWTTWLFLSIISHHQRQKWARRLLKRRLPETIPPSRRFCRCEQPILCRLPGMPEWDLQIECGDPQQVHLTHRVTGEYIVADASQRGNWPALRLERWNAYRQPDAKTDPVAKRLMALSDVGKYSATWDIYANRELRHNRLVKGFQYGLPRFCPDTMLPDYFVITKRALRQEPLVLEFLQVWKQPECQFWASALIGDWLLAHQLAIDLADEQLIEVTAPRAEACRTRRILMVKELLGDDIPHCFALAALDYLQAPEIDEYIRRGLRSAGSWQTVAEQILSSSDDSRWCEEVFNLWTSGDPSESCSVGGFVNYLLRHRYRTEEVIDFIAHELERPADAALLAMEHAPRCVLPYVREALRWNSPRDQNEHYGGQELTLKYNEATSMCQVLATIDLPWSRRELRAALSELNAGDAADRARALSIVLALGESADEKCSDIAEGWELLLDCDDFPACRERFQEMTSHPGNWITKIWHWRPLEESRS